MSAPETVVAPVEGTDTTIPPVETNKVEEPATVPGVDASAVEATPATDAEPAENPPKDDAKPEVKETVSRGNFLTKLLSFKSDKKSKAPKSPKKTGKSEEADTPAKDTPTKSVPAVEVTEPTQELTQEVTEPTEPVIAAASVPDAVPGNAKAEEPAPEEKRLTKTEKAEVKALKVGRRLSARVGDFFKSKPKSEVTPPAKVDENPPKIDEPEPVAPLENPASQAVREATVEEPVKPAEVTTPVIAATA
jgi:hypothetical protein